MQGGVWTSNGPLSLGFSTPETPGCDPEVDALTAVGFQIQADVYGLFAAELCAYDSTDSLLSCHEFAGTSTGDADDSAIFVGLHNMDPAGTRIAKVTIKTETFDFAISGPLLGVANGTTTVGAPSGIVGWWKFDEGYGITAHDSSSQGNDDWLSGAALFKPDDEKDVLFVQASGQVNYPFSGVLNPVTGTVSIWLKPGRQQAADIVRQATDMLVRADLHGTYSAYGLKVTQWG